MFRTENLYLILFTNIIELLIAQITKVNKKRNDERKGVHFEFCSNGGILGKLWVYVIANVLFVING